MEGQVAGRRLHAAGCMLQVAGCTAYRALCIRLPASNELVLCQLRDGVGYRERSESPGSVQVRSGTNEERLGMNSHTHTQSVSATMPPVFCK
jgi:hypothetical protein